MRGRWILAVHGGAGAMRTMTAAKERAYRRGLLEALRCGGFALSEGAGAVAACVDAVRSMEASGDFNAGVGGCLNADAQLEVDAAVMRAADASIGAVGGVPGVGNAVVLAEAVRRDSPHCLLVGEGATRFAEGAGVTVERVGPDPRRLARYEKLLAKQGRTAPPERAEDLTRFGGTHDEGDTVGAVALDGHGELALAVSTGGLWLKQPGRVGDSPLPGPGYWAVSGVGAATATGTGEIIIRSMLSREVVARMEGGQAPLDAGAAALSALSGRFGRGRAGLIAIDAVGRTALPFDTEGMGRGVWWVGGEPSVAVWPDEGLTHTEPPWAAG